MYKLIYHGTTSNNGVGIVVSEDLRSHVDTVQRFSDRLMSITIDMPARRLHIFSAYAPQVSCPEDNKDQFWDELQDHTSAVPADDLLLVCGDLNGHIGSARDGYQCNGGRGYGTRNDDGVRILDFAEGNDLVICNTFFKKRPSHLITYTSGGNCSQIDFVLLRRCDFSLVTNTKVIPSDHVAPQHKIVIADMKIRGHSRNAKTSGLPKIKWWKLPHNNAAISANIAFPPIDSATIDATWSALCTNVTTIAADVLGTSKPGRRRIDKQTWLWTESVQEKVQAKKMAFKEWKNNKNNDNRQKYIAARREAKVALGKARTEHFHDMYERLDSREGEKDIFRQRKILYVRQEQR